jgi:prepilin-type N-terminal cleavage/methylation domain-containing protein
MTTNRTRRGFTMIEIMVALALVSMAAAMTYVTFHGVVNAWRRGTALAEDLHHGDFVMDQLVLGLRSAYYPDSGGSVRGYGLWLEDNGSGESAADSISWVKQGSALTDSNSPTVAGPHRIQFLMTEDDQGHRVPAVRVWRPYATAKDFDYTTLDAQILSSRIHGFDCRVATNKEDGAWVWSETWEDENTNRLPMAVELTLYLAPLEPGRPPIPLKQCVEIPVWKLSGGPVAGTLGTTPSPPSPFIPPPPPRFPTPPNVPTPPLIIPPNRNLPRAFNR